MRNKAVYGGFSLEFNIFAWGMIKSLVRMVHELGDFFCGKWEKVRFELMTLNRHVAPCTLGWRLVFHWQALWVTVLSLGPKRFGTCGSYFTSGATGLHTSIRHLSRSFLLSLLALSSSRLQDTLPGERKSFAQGAKRFPFPCASTSGQARCQELIAFKQRFIQWDDSPGVIIQKWEENRLVLHLETIKAHRTWS